MKKVSDLFDMSSRTVVITGGSGYIGKRLAYAFLELGAKIVLTDRNATALEKIKDEFNVLFDDGDRVSVFPANLDSDGDVECLIRYLNALSSLDVLIHCAAFVGTTSMDGWAVPYQAQSIETWRRCIEVNLTAPFRLNQGVFEKMNESKTPSIIHFSSIYGQVGPDMSLYDGLNMGNPAAYAVSKAGLSQLSRWLATVMPAHFRINTITPGGIERGQNSDFITRYTRNVPANRMGSEDDIVGTAVLLASDAGLYINGQDIAVDGGWTAR